MAPSATLKFFRRSRMPRHPHARRQRRVDGVRRPVSLSIRHRAGGAAQRASTDPSSLRLPGRQKDCSRSPRHVFQRKCRYDAMSGCAVGTAAAPGNCTIVPCVCLRHERLRSCRALAGLRSVHRPSCFRSGCPGATRTAAGLLATSASASATMTPMSGFTLGSAGAAGGNSSILPCFWLRHESPCPCRMMDQWPRCASAKLQKLLDA
ncbi:uncharacterized protein [Dermacentor albipictus]|uniref:uncharacterized protein isoform X2 n=1 Tax=Dermacentor albipictus TaxID=60249 RepID=UPI0038FCC85F